jgi:hypothetical protein
MFETAPVSPSPPAPVSPGPSANGSAPIPATPPESAADQTAPADLDRAPRWWERFAWYAGAVLLTCVLISTGLRLDRADLRAPFYYDLDSLLILPMVKATVERGPGGHWRNEKMGAPGVMELHDFPVIDMLHFAIIWLLGKVVTHVVVLYNLYFLLTFPLTTLTAMIALRHLRLTLPAAAVGGLLYSFLPYHYQRWENHYFLASYWLVPIALLPVLAICRGNLPFFRRQPDGTYRRRLLSWGTLGLVLLGAAVASAGAYYAFFTCALAAFAGLYAWVVFRTWRAPAAAAGFITCIVAVGIVHHVPTFLYQWKYGKNPVTDRFPEEADSYGMKIAHLVLPIPDHNLRVLANLRVRYITPHRPAEGENAGSLGVVGVAGLIGLVAVALFPFRRAWPYGPLAGLTLFSILISTIGGFGSVFNLVVTAQIRGYNRFGVFVAFFCLFAALWTIDRFLLSRRGPRAARLRYAAWGGVFLVGFLDQVPYAWFKSGIVNTINEHAERFRADGRFFAEIERTMPPGSKVFCMPYAPFPEHPPVYKMPVYEHARGYIHTDTLVWSFGAMKGREHDAWQCDVAFDKPDEFLRRIVFRGFDGLLVDSRGFQVTSKEGDQARLLIGKVNDAYRTLANQQHVSLPLIAHEDGQQFFVDLRPYRDLLRQQDPVYFERGVQREREWVAVIWLDGFSSPEPRGYYDRLRYGPPRATAWVINPADRERRFRLRMTFGVDTPGPFHLRLSGLVNDAMELDKPTAVGGVPAGGEYREYDIVVPPGRHAIYFRCTTPPHFVPTDYRRLCFYIMDFSMREMP